MKQSIRGQIGPPTLISPRVEDIKGDLIPLRVGNMTREHSFPPMPTTAPALPIVSDPQKHPLTMPDQLQIKPKAVKVGRRRKILKSIPNLLCRIVKGVKAKLSRKRRNKTNNNERHKVVPTESFATTDVSEHTCPLSSTDVDPSLQQLAREKMNRPLRLSTSPLDDSSTDSIASLTDSLDQPIQAAREGSKHHSLIPKCSYFGKSHCHHADSDIKAVRSTVPKSLIKIFKSSMLPDTATKATPAYLDYEIEGPKVTSYNESFPGGEASLFPMPKDRTPAKDIAIAHTKYDFHPPGLDCCAKTGLNRTSSPKNDSSETFQTAKSRAADN